MRAGAFSRAREGKPLACKPRCGPCEYAGYSLRTTPCIDAHGELEKYPKLVGHDTGRIRPMELIRGMQSITPRYRGMS